MSKINLTAVAEKAAEFNHDINDLNKELKRVASVKCRLKKMKNRPGYEAEMTEVVKEEQLLKEAKDYITPRKVTTTTMTSADIALLNHDETIKAIKSIQSKKCNEQYLTADPMENPEYVKALEIEKLLLEHKKLVKPIEDTVVKKSTVNDLLNEVENLENVSKEWLAEQLKKLLGE